MRLITRTRRASVYHCDWRRLCQRARAVDVLIVDAPFSARTHTKHNSKGKAPAARRAGTKRASFRRLNYAFWGQKEISEFVAAWSPKTRGWFVSITDNVLAPLWRDALEAAGRYVFPPLPFVDVGSRIRLSGDGPSSWTCWIIVARPRSRAFLGWGTLPGAYIVPRGSAERRRRLVPGSKPLWLMERLVEDYSRAGNLVCDPTCGGGTTLLAAVRRGRRAIGGDRMVRHARIAAERIGERA